MAGSGDGVGGIAVGLRMADLCVRLGIRILGVDDGGKCPRRDGDWVSVTELRDEHQRHFQEWCERHPDKARAHASAYQQWADSVTSTSATRIGERWQPDETDALLSGVPLIEVALKYGRTYSSCRQALYRHRKVHGIEATLLKTASDPYGDTGCAGGREHKEI